MKEIFFKDVSDFVKKMKMIREKNFGGYESGAIWFRGQAHDWSILPKLLRGKKNKKDYFSLEESLINEFYINAMPHINRQMNSGWEWLALMQHRGLPTRLLDWTENALQALYFAVSHFEEADSPVVIAMVPDQFNQIIFNDNNSAIAIAENNKLNSWLPPTLHHLNRTHFSSEVFPAVAYPVCISIPHVDERMARQKGTFMVWPSASTKNLAKFKVNAKKKTIVKFKLQWKGLDEERAELKKTLLDDLNLLGVNEYTTNGDLDSLSKHISWQFLSGRK